MSPEKCFRAVQINVLRTSLFARTFTPPLFFEVRGVGPPSKNEGPETLSYAALKHFSGDLVRKVCSAGVPPPPEVLLR